MNRDPMNLILEATSPTSNSRKRPQVADDPETLEALRTPKRTKTWMEMFECPICMELPRSGPIYGCRNGHHLCQNCSSKVDTCPVCREKDVKCRNILAEKIIQEALQDVPIKCKFTACKVKSLMAQLGDHEQVCAHRQVPCPSSHRNACTWQGSLTGLIHHIKEKKCVQVIFDKTWTKARSRLINAGVDSIEDNLAMEVESPVFKSCLGDFSANSPSVFERPNVITHWKPIILLSKKLLNYWLYVVVQRDSRGIWTLMVRAMLPAKMCDKVRVKVKVMDGQEDETPATYVYNGKIVCYEMSKEEAMKTGRFLCLTDDQIKQFKGRDTNLFHYSVEVCVDPDLEQEMKVLINATSAKKTVSVSTEEESEEECN